jgi:hypothetical protein
MPACAPCGAQRSTSLEVARARRPLWERQPRLAVMSPGRVVAALMVGLAGLIHLALIREHFEEQVAYGLIFTALAVFQLCLAWLLVARPGPRVYNAGIVGSGPIVLIALCCGLPLLLLMGKRSRSPDQR